MCVCVSLRRQHRSSRLFPYTTLFRSPFLLLSGRSAAWTAFTIAMLSHFAVGGARSFFTGRGVIRSGIDRKSTRLNSSHVEISYAVFCLKKKIDIQITLPQLLRDFIGI